MLLCSAPRTPLDDPVIGFQVDKLINAIRGEAKIKITVYEHDQGQVWAGLMTISQSVGLSVGHCQAQSLFLCEAVCLSVCLSTRPPVVHPLIRSLILLKAKFVHNDVAKISLSCTSNLFGISVFSLVYLSG